MKLTAKEQAQHAEFVESLNSSQLSIQAALDAYNALVTDAAEFVTSTADRLQEDFDEKSEKWQQCDAGLSASDLISAWSINDDVAEVDFTFVEDFESLPMESE